jgi:hypothetical protein
MAGTALAITAAVLAAAAPITLVAAIAYTGAWLRAWPPAKLWRAAECEQFQRLTYVVGCSRGANQAGTPFLETPGDP